MEDKLIYGNDPTEKIVALEVKDNTTYAFFNDGTCKTQPALYWMLGSRQIDNNFERLDGDRYYNWVRTFDNEEEFKLTKKNYWKYKESKWNIANYSEMHMLTKGTTLFKGLKVSEVSRLGFDIESDGLTHHCDSKVFTIANTFRDGKGNETVKVFRLDDYGNDCGSLIKDWCDYVREIDPTILVAHNGIGYDLPYLKHVASLFNTSLVLGRDNSEVEFSTYTKQYRVDGSQEWDYKDIKIFGRHIIDTMFLAVKYDIGRNFPSWGLKPIIEHLGMVDDDRVFYDASKIGKNWYIPEEREKIVKYCEDDGTDCLNLYELMIPSYFYMCQSIPKTFQTMLLGASGGWVNSILIRAYLQDFKSIPKPSEPEKVHGGISFGIPGVYKNVFKIDIISMYPSIIRSLGLYSKHKDPDSIYLYITNIFTNNRLDNKKKYKETKDTHYNDLQSSQKILINSLFGLCGTKGLHFNDYDLANTITRNARNILKKSIDWATSKNINHWFESYDNNKDV